MWDIRDSGLVVRLGLLLRAGPKDAAFRDGKEQNCPVCQLLSKACALAFLKVCTAPLVI